MTDGSPRVTVGIPVFNGADTIAETIESVIAQDYNALEILVSDNASTDSTLDVVRSISDPRIRILTSEDNVGPGRNWNKVLENARGEYVKVLSADDVLLPGAITLQVRALDAHPNVVIATGARVLIDAAGRRIGTRRPGRFRGVVSGVEVARAMVRTGTNLIGEPSAVLIRRTALRGAGTFDEESPYCVDMDLWFRLLEQGDAHITVEPVVMYRVAAGSWTEGVQDRQAADVERLLRTVAASGVFGIDPADLDRGIRGARRNARMRRMLYRILALPSFQREMIAYVIAGGWNTLFGYAAFAMLWALMGAMTSYAVVLVLAYAVAAVNAYLSYRIFVFRSRADMRSEAPRFMLVYAAALVANVLVFPALVSELGLNPYIAQALFTVFIVIATYVAHRRFTFSVSSKAR